MAEKKIKITMVGSKNHRSKDHLRTLNALGLKKINQTRELPDNAAVRGMAKKLYYMVKVEEA